MAHAVNSEEYPVFDASMRAALVISGLFHLAIFVFTVITLPFVMNTPPDVSTPISVEIVDIADIAQTNKVQAPTEKKEEPSEKPQPEKMESKPSPPPPVEESKPDVPAPAPLEKTKPPEEKEKPVEKKPPVKSQEKDDSKKKDFNSLLKNLAPDASQKTEPQKDIKDVLAGTTEDAQNLPLGERMTMTEMDALRHQLAGCWIVPTGAKYAENLAVEIRISVNPDRTVRNVSVVNQILYSTDSHYQAAADAAMRAVRNQKCSPLQLPPGKYTEWKEMVINFDPREML